LFLLLNEPIATVGVIFALARSAVPPSAQDHPERGRTPESKLSLLRASEPAGEIPSIARELYTSEQLTFSRIFVRNGQKTPILYVTSMQLQGILKLHLKKVLHSSLPLV
jgi:hypothetical protein